MLKKLIVLGFMLALASVSWGGNFAFTGGGTGSTWFDSDNWEGGTIPVDSDIVHVGARGTGTFDYTTIDAPGAVCAYIWLAYSNNARIDMTTGSTLALGEGVITMGTPNDGPGEGQTGTFNMHGNAAVTTNNCIQVGSKGNGSLNMYDTSNITITGGNGFQVGANYGQGLARVELHNNSWIKFPIMVINPNDGVGGYTSNPLNGINLSDAAELRWVANQEGNTQLIGFISSGKITGGGVVGNVEVTYLPAEDYTRIRAFQATPEAYRPTPVDNQTGVALPVTLSWYPGLYAVSHNVYLGTNPNALVQVSTNQTTTNYNAGVLNLGKTYYWRIDEVNDGVVGSPWTGNVWSFTTIGYTAIDDFESYDSDMNDITAKWPSGTLDYTSGSTVSLATAEKHGGAQAMQFDYDNTGNVAGDFKFSKTTRSFSPALNFTANSVTALDIWVMGTAGNASDGLYAILTSGATSQTIELKTFDGNSPDLASPTWQVVRVNLNTVTINKSNITKIAIATGDLNNVIVGGTGTIYIDDIRLYPARCLNGQPDGDINGDCKTDFLDVAGMANNWFESGMWP